MIRKLLLIAAVVLLPPALAAAQPSASPQAAVSESRVEAIEPLLAERPFGIGPPASDRESWARLARVEAFATTVRRADELLKSEFPALPDDLYLDFSRTGNRTRFQTVAFARRSWLGQLAVAECVTNEGRYLAALVDVIRRICAEKTWVLPAHDLDLANFEGRGVTIDLFSSDVASELATVDHLLGDALPEDVRRLLRDRCDHFVLDPWKRALAGESRAAGWMKSAHNWNAVCLANCTAAALALVDDRRERARFVAGAEQHSLAFLGGFTPDGYCSEGLGYWNYGFGHYVMLAEMIRQATAGRLDLFDRPQVKAPAAFGWRIMIADGVAPAFADCGVYPKPSPALMAYVLRRAKASYRGWERLPPGYAPKSAAEMMMHHGLAVFEPMPEPPQPLEIGPRDWFADAGVLVGRPTTGRLGVALKGGHNAEFHNHNDLGSFVVVVGGRCVLLDPGPETYTRRTFSKERYASKLLNSFGHPVPVVGGRLQRTGRDAAARILATDFTPTSDTLTMDLASAYDAPGLRELTRIFTFDRAADTLTVSDRVAFAEPDTFETALVTLGTWTRGDDGTLDIRDGDSGVTVKIDTGGTSHDVTAEQITEDAPVRATRIAIRLTSRVTAAAIRLTIEPAPK
ncbi:MAG: heparinase II/III family protein [Pirellulales bacterium]